MDLPRPGTVRWGDPMRRVPGLLALGALRACSRSLDVLQAAPLQLSPQFSSVAPRDVLQFSASGGSGGQIAFYT